MDNVSCLLKKLKSLKLLCIAFVKFPKVRRYQNDRLTDVSAFIIHLGKTWRHICYIYFLHATEPICKLGP